MKLDQIKSTLYFAYGHNTNSHEMLRRVPNAQFVRRGVLPYWQMEFIEFANIRQQLDSQVWGVIWKIPQNELANLDQSERLHSHYTRIRVPIETPDKIYRAWTYVMEPQFHPHIAPRDDYVQDLIRGYQEHQLPKSQIQDALSRAES